MQRIHVVGRKNHGKTTFVRELIAELRDRGLAVGSIKHSGHQHELDRPGSDSHGHRMAGASPAAVVARDLMAVFTPRAPDDDPFVALAGVYAACDVVIVEGGHHYAGGLKVEVWRAAPGTASLATERDDILAVISDDAPAVSVPVWPRRVAAVADRLLAALDAASS